MPFIMDYQTNSDINRKSKWSFTKTYVMVEKMNQKLEVRYESQQAYTSSRRFPRYKFGAPQNCPQRSEWRNQGNDHSRQDLHKQFNYKPIQFKQ